MRRTVTSLAVMLLVFSVAAGCRSTTGKSLGQNIDDKTITTTVKSKLVADRAKNLVSVDVDTNQGTVYLTGNVATAQQKADAEQITRSVEGVRNVVNNLQVTPRAAGDTRPVTGGSASPATGDFTGRHTMTGEVTQVASERGHVHLKTPEGELVLHFPPATLRDVKPGDRLTVELAVRPAR
jgi:hyperosmotically inducible protein